MVYDESQINGGTSAQRFTLHTPSLFMEMRDPSCNLLSGNECCYMLQLPYVLMSSSG